MGEQQQQQQLRRRVFFVLVALVVVSSAECCSASRISLNDEDSYTNVITSVLPSLIPVPAGVNISVGYVGYVPYGECVQCAFNTSGNSVEMFTPARRNGNQGFACPFPSPSKYQLQANTVVQVWLQQCGSGDGSGSGSGFGGSGSGFGGEPITSNTWTLYLYDIVPSIVSVSPDVAVATGGTNLTVELKNPFLNLPLSVNLQCFISSSQYTMPGFFTGDPSKVLCQTTVIPIGPGNLTVGWVSGYAVPILTTPNSYPITIRSNRILSISPTSGCVLGGANITLNMQTPSSRFQSCLFVPKSAEGEEDHEAALISPALVSEDNGAVICQTPAWPNALPMTATLSLIEVWTKTPITNPVSFYFNPYCATQLSPNPVCTLGSVPVTLSGIGFPDLTSPIANDLQVKLWQTPDMTPGTLLDFALVTVINSTTATYTTSSREYHYDTLYVQLTNPYFGAVASSPILSVMNTNSCLSSVTPTQLSIDGGDLVTIKASLYTFGAPATLCLGQPCYNCVFKDVDDNMITQPATVLSPYKATCISPPVYGPGKGTVAISFLLSTNGILTDPFDVSWS